MNDSVGGAPAATPWARACHSVWERRAETRPQSTTRSSGTVSGGRGEAHRLVEELDDVGDAQVLVARRLGPVLEAGDLVGAAHGQRHGARLGRLPDPALRQPLAGVVGGEPVEPHAAPAAAAAVAVLPGPLHLDQVEAGDRLDEAPGSVVLAAVAAEVAGVVERDVEGDLVDEVGLVHER